MSTAFVPWIDSKHYQLFKRIIRPHPDLPDTFDEWLYLSNKKIAEHEATGGTAKKVSVNPDEFIRFCDRTNSHRDVTALGNFAAEKGLG